MSENDKITALKELEKDDIHEAKRDMVMRFVKDQESLQTSQVELKLVGDETIDLIDSALVAKDEDDGANERFDETQNDQLTRDISVITLEGNNSSETGTEHRVLPRPPSRACRPKSRTRKLSATKSEERKRKASQEQPTSFHQFNPQESISEPKSPPWRQNRASPFNKYTLYSTSDPLHSYSTVDNYADTRGNIFEHPRPKSTRTLRRIRSGELITARIASANAPERITCGAISTLIRTTSRPKSKSYSEDRNNSNNRQTFVNLGAIDKQVSFDGPLELEPVNPSEFPIFRSNSAASSAVPYALVQLPPISTEAPPSASFPPS